MSPKSDTKGDPESRVNAGDSQTTQRSADKRHSFLGRTFSKQNRGTAKRFFSELSVISRPQFGVLTSARCICADMGWNVSHMVGIVSA